MKIKELEKVENLVEFKETLIKLFCSRTGGDAIFIKVKPKNRNGEEFKFFYPLYEIKSYKDFLKLDCEAILKTNYYRNDLIKNKKRINILDLDIIEDNDEFLDKVEDKDYYYIGNKQFNLIFKSICEPVFLRH